MKEHSKREKNKLKKSSVKRENISIPSTFDKKKQFKKGLNRSKSPKATTTLTIKNPKLKNAKKSVSKLVNQPKKVASKKRKSNDDTESVAKKKKSSSN